MTQEFDLQPVDALLSRPQVSERGLSTAGATPADYREITIKGRLIRYPVYRASELRPKRWHVVWPAVMVDLLLAIFTVNRTAKRYRDKAAGHYSDRQHGFEKDARERKEALYVLKDAGMVAAHRAGLIFATGTHGPLCYYEGHGYRFHSLLWPVGVELPVIGEGPVEVEAKPKGSRECRLVDAEATLAGLPTGTAGFAPPLPGEGAEAPLERRGRRLEG